jgi:hypothetical protein
MRVGMLTHTTVSDGQRARAASSVAYWPACRAEGAAACDAGAEEGADCCHHGNRDPDWEAGAGAGAGAGAEAKPPEDEAVEVWRARHCDRNCDHVWPAVVPAALASFHWLAHRLMTLWPVDEPPTFEAAAEVGADGCDQGNREGAAVEEDGAGVAPWRVRH